MNFSEAISFSFQALKANRLRTFLTALGLIIGNASVILVVTISLASKDLILDQIRGVGSNLVFAYYEAGGQNTAKIQGDFVKLSDVQALRDALGNQIVAATAVMTSHDQIVVHGKVRELTVDGVDAEYPQVRPLVILEGRSIDASDVALRSRVAMLTDKLALRLFGGQDAAIGQTIKISQLQFTVIGTFREKTSTFGQGEMHDETVLIPITVMKYFMQYEKIEPVYVQVRDAGDVPAVTEQVNNILESRHRIGAKYDVQNLVAVLETADTIASVLTMVLILVSFIALLISGIGIMNIMLVTVTERTREIGLRMAVGASRREILLQFLVEAVVMSVVGGALGIVIGIAIPLSVPLLISLLDVPLAIKVPVSPISVLVAFVVSFVVGVTFGLLPARRASQLNPTEALRYE
jgi:putative ABC transport system permease protein